MIRRRRLKERPEHFRLNPGAPLASGLVFAALGRFRGTAQCFDSSLFGNHGTLTNMDPPTDWVWVPELGRWATDYVAASSQWTTISSALLLSAPMTFAVHVKVPNVTATQRIMSIHTGIDATNRWLLGTGVSGAGNIDFFARDGGPAGIATSTATCVNDEWFHAAGVEISTASRVVYKNAGAVGTNSTSKTPSGMDATSLAGNGALYSTVTVADAFIWSRALSLPEIAALADPSNAMLSVGGCPLILPPRRTIFASAVGAPATNRRRRFLIGAAA